MKQDKIKDISQKLITKFSLQIDDCFLIAEISQQKLFLIQHENITKQYPISTSKYGIGNVENSNKTPLGIHRIIQKIGEDAPKLGIFRMRRFSGEIAIPDQSKEDLITTRIFILQGLEEGINSGKDIDSRIRGIFIHGTQAESKIGKPASHGCIRMKNDDVIDLFGLIKIGTLLDIRK